MYAHLTHAKLFNIFATPGNPSCSGVSSLDVQWPGQISRLIYVYMKHWFIFYIKDIVPGEMQSWFQLMAYHGDSVHNEQLAKTIIDPHRSTIDGPCAISGHKFAVHSLRR